MNLTTNKHSPQKQDLENKQSFLDRIKKLDNLTKKERYLIMKAYDISKEAHGYMKQTRDGGGRYFEHPRAVALILIDEIGICTYEEIVSALLHDVCEDTFIWDVRFLRHVFGQEVANIVSVLSKPKKIEGDKTEFNQKYFKRIHREGFSTCLIKIADRVHNLRSMSSWVVPRQEKYIEEVKVYFLDIAAYLMKDQVWEPYFDKLSLGDEERVCMFDKYENLRKELRSFTRIDFSKEEKVKKPD